jgi:hypothetical protein
MNELDLLEVVRVTLDAIDKLAEHALRVDGSVESQKGAALAHRGRALLDGIAMRAPEKGAAWDA